MSVFGSIHHKKQLLRLAPIHLQKPFILPASKPCFGDYAKLRNEEARRLFPEMGNTPALTKFQVKVRGKDAVLVFPTPIKAVQLDDERFELTRWDEFTEKDPVKITAHFVALVSAPSKKRYSAVASHCKKKRHRSLTPIIHCEERISTANPFQDRYQEEKEVQSEVYNEDANVKESSTNSHFLGHF